jgi:N-acetylglucosamine kinase-like BadF-type ATPase
LWASTDEPAAVIVQHGSGYTSGYRAVLGGEQLFDHLNVGGIFDMRGGVLRVVARMIDGREKPTGLKDAVVRFFETTDEGFAEKIFRGDIPFSKSGHVVSAIYAAWERGDEAADKLVRQAVEDYALAAKTMAGKIGGKAVLSFGGGVIHQAPRAFWSLLTDRLSALCASCVVQAPRYTAEYGAAFMAAFHAGRNVQEFFSNASSPMRQLVKLPIDCV